MEYHFDNPVEFASQRARLLPGPVRDPLCKLSRFKNFEERPLAFENLMDKLLHDAMTFFGLLCEACTVRRAVTVWSAAAGGAG